MWTFSFIFCPLAKAEAVPLAALNRQICMKKKSQVTMILSFSLFFRKLSLGGGEGDLKGGNRLPPACCYRSSQSPGKKRIPLGAVPGALACRTGAWASAVRGHSPAPLRASEREKGRRGDGRGARAGGRGSRGGGWVDGRGRAQREERRSPSAKIKGDVESPNRLK